MLNRSEHVTEKAINLLKNIDADEFMRQKNWIYEQVCILTPSGEDAARFPQGILTMMDNIQDFCENELKMEFPSPIPENRECNISSHKSIEEFRPEYPKNDTEEESDSIIKENT